MRARPQRLATSTISAVVVVSAVAVAATPASAGTATLDGTTARYADPAGTRDDLTVRIETMTAQEDALDMLEGWRVGFAQSAPESGKATTPGAGCRVGFLDAVCPTGAVAPGVGIDLGGGNDLLSVLTLPASRGPKVTIAGGPGDDEIELYQTTADVDGGPGDDMISPEDRGSVRILPPAISPGGVIRGGDGTDTAFYGGSLASIDVSLDGRPNDGRKGEGDNVMPDVENVIGTGPGGGTLIGSTGPNKLEGFAGTDRVVGGAGKDDLDGGAGNDTVDALDGAGGDRVTCGSGVDVAYLDGGDLTTGTPKSETGCEKVVYAPGVPGSLRFRSKRIAVSVSCPKVSTATCSGTVRLTSTAGKKVGSASYRVKRGKKTTVSLRVSKKPARKAVLVVAPKGSKPVTGRAVTVR